MVRINPSNSAIVPVINFASSSTTYVPLPALQAAVGGPLRITKAQWHRARQVEGIKFWKAPDALLRKLKQQKQLQEKSSRCTLVCITAAVALLTEVHVPRVVIDSMLAKVQAAAPQLQQPQQQGEHSLQDMVQWQGSLVTQQPPPPAAVQPPPPPPLPAAEVLAKVQQCAQLLGTMQQQMLDMVAAVGGALMQQQQQQQQQPPHPWQQPAAAPAASPAAGAALGQHAAAGKLLGSMQQHWGGVGPTQHTPQQQQQQQQQQLPPQPHQYTSAAEAHVAAAQAAAAQATAAVNALERRRVQVKPQPPPRPATGQGSKPPPLGQLLGGLGKQVRGVMQRQAAALHAPCTRV
jgi:hypothetical protein